MKEDDGVASAATIVRLAALTAVETAVKTAVKTTVATAAETAMGTTVSAAIMHRWMWSACFAIGSPGGSSVACTYGKVLLPDSRFSEYK